MKKDTRIWICEAGESYDGPDEETTYFRSRQNAVKRAHELMDEHENREDPTEWEPWCSTYFTEHMLQWKRQHIEHPSRQMYVSVHSAPLLD